MAEVDSGGAPDEGLEELRTAKHRDANMDKLAEQVEIELDLDLFESKTDVLSVEYLREAYKRLAAHPVHGRVIAALDDLARNKAQSLLTRTFASEEEPELDEFGCDPEFVEKVRPLAKFFHDKYFRVESRGVEHIPNEGRALLVANHSGTLPYDGAMVVSAVTLRHPAQRLVRSLVEDFLYHMPYLGQFMSRVGAVRACQENARRLLDNDEAVLVFPEGVKGIGKLYRKRYVLQRFGRGGAVKLAMLSQAPIVPVSIVGAEESMPLIAKMTWLARAVGIPYLPITPTWPLLGPLGLVPFPTKWFIDFAPPVDVVQHGPEAIGDRVLVNRINEQVRSTIQDMIDRRLRERQSVFFG